MYIAQNGGAIHIAPMPGHFGTVIASNLGGPPGAVPFNPFIGPRPFAPGLAVDIAPPFGPGQVPPGPLPPRPIPPLISPPRPVPPPISPPSGLPPIPLTRTW